MNFRLKMHDHPGTWSYVHYTRGGLLLRENCRKSIDGKHFGRARWNSKNAYFAITAE
jgi:hypothetical protein